MQKVNIILAFLALQLLQPVFPQDEKPRFYSVALVPQYLFVSGLRVDFEYNINKNNWIQFAPQVYQNESSGRLINSKYRSVNGTGCMVSHKIFLYKERNSPEGAYFSYGLGYNYFDLISVNQQTNLTSTLRVDALSSDITMGYQFIASQRLLFDIYWGLGTKYSFITHISGIGTETYNATVYDFDYSGNRFVGGFRIGFIF